MRITKKTLDDLLRTLYPKLLSSTDRISSSRGKSRELTGVLLELKIPRARLSRTETRGKPFSCLGEFLWYMSGDNRLDFIRYYIPKYAEDSEDGETVYGGYGPRLFNLRGQNQLQNVIDLLKKKPESRRAAIQLFNAEDIAHERKEVPCTCTFQFFVRRKKLQMLTTMRSNDAYIGLPHDIFCFTMLQELVASALDLELGPYKHFVGSLHLYEKDAEKARQYLSECVQSVVLMPPMPKGDPWPALQKLQKAEYRIRQGSKFDATEYGLHAYWTDVIRLLQILAASGDPAEINALKTQMTFPRYAPYIDGRKTMNPPKHSIPREPLLPFD